MEKQLSILIFVDGGLIEAFANDLKAITPMVAPNVASGLLATRTNRAFGGKR